MARRLCTRLRESVRGAWRPEVKRAAALLPISKRGHPMDEGTEVVVERVADDGRWFDQGERVEFFPRAGGHFPPTLEKAALGAYEVVACTLAHERGTRWLDVTLRRAFRTMRSRTRRVGD